MYLNCHLYMCYLDSIKATFKINMEKKYNYIERMFIDIIEFLNLIFFKII